MAQVDDIFEQVDEQLDADRAQKFWEENRVYIIGALIALFAGLIIYVNWRDGRIEEDQHLSVQFLQAQEYMQVGDWPQAKAALDGLSAQASGHGYGQLAQLSKAQGLAQNGQIEDAVAVLKRLTVDHSGTLMADLALIMAAYLVEKDAQQSRSFLSQIDEKSPYKAHALELQGLLLAREGDEKGALSHYQEALKLPVEGSLQNRLQERVERMAGSY